MRPLLRHQRKNLPRHQVHARQVGIDGALPAGHVGALDDLTATNAGVVDEDIHLLDQAVQRAKTLGDALLFGDVHGNRRGLGPLGPDLCRRFLQLLRRTGSNDDVRAWLGERQRDRAPNPAPAAGDNHRPCCAGRGVSHRPRRRPYRARVISRILFEVGQRFERTHPVQKQHAVEMIAFVLDDAGREVLELQLEALAVAIEGGHLDVLGAGDAAAHLGNAQAALPALDRLIADHDDLGIDEDDSVAFAAAVRVQHRHEHPQPLVHLRRREADARSTRTWCRSCCR